VLAASPVQLDVGGNCVRLVAPLGNPFTPGLSKARRLSYVGLCEGRKVKVYGSHSTAQTELRQTVQRMGFSGIYFPRIIASAGGIVAEEWVDGEVMDTSRARDVSDFLNQLTLEITSSTIQKLSGAFCYFENYLIVRLQPWIHIPQIAAFVETWRLRYEAEKACIPVLLSHPDLSFNNIIIQRGSHKAYVIDNELLGVGRGWILDWHNSLLRNLNIPPPRRLEQVEPGLIAMTWVLRKLGSALDNHNLPLAMELVDQWEKFH